MAKNKKVTRSEQRSVRIQRIIFFTVSAIILMAMLLSMVAR
jgi:predicted nucleic acid-binding Zn ribbon protein